VECTSLENLSVALTEPHRRLRESLSEITRKSEDIMRTESIKPAGARIKAKDEDEFRQREKLAEKKRDDRGDGSTPKDGRSADK